MKHCKREDIRFVTLEDILGGQQGLNWVIYNPILDKIDNEKILRNVTKHRALEIQSFLNTLYICKTKIGIFIWHHSDKIIC